MKLAIMQPYLLPYLAYFQLIESVDTFVVYDDVAFIKQGWINRNRICVKEEARYFSVPLTGASSNTLIKDVHISAAEYTRWRDKYYKTLKFNYGRKFGYDESINIIEEIFNQRPDNIAQLAHKSISVCCKALGITTDICESSIEFGNSRLTGVGRVIDICRSANADTYINSIGGKSLYSPELFQEQGIRLKFLESHPNKHTSLSIVDTLMNLGIDDTRNVLSNYHII